MRLSPVRKWFGSGQVLLFVLVPWLLVAPMAVKSQTVMDGGTGGLPDLVVPSGTVGTTDEIASELAGPPTVDPAGDPPTRPISGGPDSDEFGSSPGVVLALTAVEGFESPDDADGERDQDATRQVGEETIPTAGELAVSPGSTIELQSITGSLILPFEEEGWGRVATFVASSAEDRDSMNWSLSGTDAQHFSIDSPGGALRFHIDPVSPNRFPEPPDYENPADADSDNAYEITVEASDSTSTVTADLVVSVTNVDEDGTASLPTLRPEVGSALAASLNDPEGVVGSIDWRWERSAGRNSWAVIDGADAASYTPGAADSGQYLRVMAFYSDGAGSGKWATANTYEVVRAGRLEALSVSTTDSGKGIGWREMRPDFRPEILHYSIGCAKPDTMTLTLQTADITSRVSVNGTQVVGTGGNGSVVASLDVAGNDVVRVAVADSDGGSTEYSIHCLHQYFPEIRVTKNPDTPDVLEELMMFPGDQNLLIIDNNAVPRFHRGWRRHAWLDCRYYECIYDAYHDYGTYFRFHENGGDGEYRYSYTTSGSNASLVLDENLEPISGAVLTVPPLTVTAGSDFRVLDDGNYMLMAYQPAVRDLSYLRFNDVTGQPFGTAVNVEDSVIQIVTPGGDEVFNWNSYDHMPLEDCTHHWFPWPSESGNPDWAHLNSMQMSEGRIIASFLGCNSILSIDAGTGDVLWRVGLTNLTGEEWEERGIGPAPMRIVGDPEGEFCGQRAAQMLPNGNLLLYDNGTLCSRNPGAGENLVRQVHRFTVHGIKLELEGSRGENLAREDYTFSRGLEYALDLANNEAVFARDHSLRDTRDRLGLATGHIEPLHNGDWLITWGVHWPGSRPPYPPDEEVTQVDPDTGVEKLALHLPLDLFYSFGSQTTRVTTMPPWALAAQPIALTAEIYDATPFHFSSSGYNEMYDDHSPHVVVAFSRPVVDFDHTTPSISIQGGTVSGVTPFLMDHAPANAYLITLTPTLDDPITLTLATDKPCTSGGICTADRTRLTGVPAYATIPPGDWWTIRIYDGYSGEPTFDEWPSTARQVVENTPGETAVGDPVMAGDPDRDALYYVLAGPDAAQFDIDRMSGQILTKAGLDYETRNVYTLVVGVSDANRFGDPDGALDTSTTVRIDVVDTDEEGVVTLSAPTPRVGVPLHAVLTDPDGESSEVTWQWATLADTALWTAIRGATSDSYTPTADNEGRFIRAVATYTDAFGSNKTAIGIPTSEARVGITTGYRDVDRNGIHTEAIEALAGQGVFVDTECGPDRFCPGEPIRRWVMAVWLVRLLEAQQPATIGSSRFADITSGQWWIRYIEQLADRGITAGCATDPLLYCPDQPVSRAQMATFLARALNLQPEMADGFADTTNTAHSGSINALAQAGITAGCATDPLLYCPDQPVSRAQMASFLHRTLASIGNRTPAVQESSVSPSLARDRSASLVDEDGLTRPSD